MNLPTISTTATVTNFWKIGRSKGIHYDTTSNDRKQQKHPTVVLSHHRISLHLKLLLSSLLVVIVVVVVVVSVLLCLGVVLENNNVPGASTGTGTVSMPTMTLTTDDIASSTLYQSKNKRDTMKESLFKHGAVDDDDDAAGAAGTAGTGAGAGAAVVNDETAVSIQNNIDDEKTQHQTQSEHSQQQQTQEQQSRQIQEQEQEQQTSQQRNQERIQQHNQQSQRRIQTTLPCPTSVIDATTLIAAINNATTDRFGPPTVITICSSTNSLITIPGLIKTLPPPSLNYTVDDIIVNDTFGLDVSYKNIDLVCQIDDPINDGPCTLFGSYNGTPTDSLFFGTGLLYVNSATIRMKGFVFVNGGNRLVEHSAGGAIQIVNGSDVTIQDCIFFNNRAVHGGAIYVDGSNLRLDGTIASSTKRRRRRSTRRQLMNTNTSSDTGSTTSTTGSTDPRVLKKYNLRRQLQTDDDDTEKSIIFLGNLGWSGGAIDSSGNDASIVGTNIAFITNIALRYGGAICLYCTTTTSITNSTFIGNYADGDGGALYSFNNATTSIDTTTFVENVAQYFGSVAEVAESSVVKFLDCTMADNTANVEMTNFSIVPDDILNDDDITFDDDVVDDDIGSIFDDDDDSLFGGGGHHQNRGGVSGGGGGFLLDHLLARINSNNKENIDENSGSSGSFFDRFYGDDVDDVDSTILTQGITHSDNDDNSISTTTVYHRNGFTIQQRFRDRDFSTELEAQFRSSALRSGQNARVDLINTIFRENTSGKRSNQVTNVNLYEDGTVTCSNVTFCQRRGIEGVPAGTVDGCLGSEGNVVRKRRRFFDRQSGDDTSVCG